MSDETPGAGQGALPPREDSASRPAVRLTQVQAGQYILTSQTHLPTLTQITGGNVATNATLTSGGVTRIISLSPARSQTAPLRPSLTNQSIVNALTKSRSNSNVRLQLFPSGDASPQNATPTRSPVKRSLPATSEKKDTYASKLQRVMNHRNVRSKIVKEKFNEHLLECYYLEIGGNILDLYQFAKRPKTQQFLAYIKENAIDPKEHVGEVSNSQPVATVVTTPTATSASSLPGLSQTSTSTPVQSSQALSTQTTPSDEPSTPKSSNENKMKAVGYPAGTNQEQIVEKAKQEAYVVQRISDLQKEGLWSEKRLPKIQEMTRTKAHWDFLLEEMVWLAADFAQERKWKKAAAKKCARMVQKYFQDKTLAAQRAEKAQEQHIRRVAAFCAKEIKTFWSNVEKLVEYKQNTRLEEKRKKALDQHLSFIVDQTEKYSQLLAEGMNKPGITTSEQPVPGSNASSRSNSRANSDDEFQPNSENSSDDEETIAQAEATNKEEESAEVAALQKESEMDFEAFVSEVLPKDYLENRERINVSENEHSEAEEIVGDSNDDALQSSDTKSKNDQDFIAASSGEEDDEETIAEQEEVDGNQDHRQELEDLQAENNMSVEELKKRYANLPEIPADDTNMSVVSSEGSESADGDDESTSEESDDSGADYLDESAHSDEGEEEYGLKSLLDDATESQNDEGEEKKTDNNDLINDAAAIAESIQPKGNTLSSTSVVTPVPFLLKLPLREYQHIGLDWLVTMFERKLNGILADEMGLGKTIQTIALLSHLACEKENWGPHLIIVPTSVMLNWEMECKKWCPAFKILTYYGTQKERKLKRTGWTKPNAFHICITSYKLVIQDHQSFRRKKWKYLILDEAQNIKNFKSQRWQLLLNFQTQQRLLLTGTPLQNNLMELWSLMHFLMPNVFQSHREFKEWFSNPVTGMIEGNSEYNESIIKRLHKVLRPFLLRRLKSEVEKQMPKKYEHIIMCRLSKRQRFLYDDYMSRAKTRETLASGNLLSVINVLMQLRKVCNHPNLFEVRPTISPFHCEGITQHIPSLVYNLFEYDPLKNVDLISLNLNLLALEFYLSAYQCYRMRQYQTPRKLIEEMDAGEDNPPDCPPARLSMRVKKSAVSKEIKTEPKEEITTKPNPLLQNNSNVKIKVGPGVQLVQQGIPLSQVSASQSGANINLSSVLKPSEKITVPAGFAQLVQTSTGKHILFTPSSCITTSNLAMGSATVMTSSGQRLTVLSQSVSPNTNSTPQTLTKAVVKVQLTSIPSTTTTSTMSASSPEIKFDDRNPLQTRTVSSKYLEKLYANQSSKKDLDVRWMNNDEEKKETEYSENMESISKDCRKNKMQLISKTNSKRCNAIPLYGQDFREAVKISTCRKSNWINGCAYCFNVHYSTDADNTTDCLQSLIFRPADRMEQLKDVFNRFIVYVPAVHAPEAELQIWHPSPSTYWGRKQEKQILVQNLSRPTTLLHPIVSAMVTQFPHPRLIQYDCGKLQTLDKLLRRLKTGGHRVLIFTQMTKMLDVLEAFLNFHGHIYLRLDGTTKVDQRQMLMERFNSDKRLFAFILSTRSGGIGVNLTGADTVIFYDSDWNPTMDAQAQDRCHRIGQTRDVHIYRLISERTIEENILKKANQKRLLGDLAIEGGNFTTAYFKSSTIQDLFNIDANQEAAALRMSEVLESNREREKRLSDDQAVAVPAATPEDKAAMGALENALAACEDDQDVQAARTAKAEAVADLAEFDENIPLEEQEKEREPEISKAEQEVENLIKQLTPIERYAMRFIEETEAAWSAEQLAAAEREIEEQKLEWERNRLAAMREEEERRTRELEEENELLTFSREDATNQMWCPPTPPQQDTDVYIDQTMTFLYDANVMTELQLPAVYVKKEAKRSRHEAGLIDSRRALKIHRKDENVYAPRSLFERPSPALVKMRRDIKLQKYRGIVRPPVPIPGMKLAVSKPSVDPPCFHNWTVHEDMALLKVIQSFQGLSLNLMILTPGHTPNWDFVADYVNTVSITYRSPKQCRNRYETVIIPREEGKQVFDSSPRKKKNKGNLYKFPMQNKSTRPMRTSQLYTQDNNASFSQIMIQRYESLKGVASKRTSVTKTVVNNPPLKNPKHAAVLNECGIDLDHPVLPVEVAARRAERIAREKKTPEHLAAQRLPIKGAITATQSLSGIPQPSSTPPISGSSTVQVVTSPVPQVTAVQTTAVTTIATSVITTPGTPPGALRTQRIVASPMQTSTVVSVSGLSPAQLQAATQRLIVSGASGQTKTVVGGTATMSGKTISQAQLQMIRQATLKQQQLRLQAGGIGAQTVKTSTVTIAGQPTVQVQFTQAQPRTQYVKPGTVTVTGKQGITRPVTEIEMAQFIKRQQQMQQQKVLAAAAAASGSQSAAVQNITSQGFQAIQQAGSSTAQVTTLVKAVSNSGVTQTVSIPVTGVTIGQVKALAPGGIKTTNPQQLRQLQIQQQLLAQKKMNQKIGIAQVTGKGGVATQLIVGSKPFSSPITMQQIQQVIRSPLQQGPVVLAKGMSRVIPVNAAAQGNKPTIQVVAATSQGITTTIRPQSSSTLAGALAGIKVQGNATPVQQAALLSQVSAALQGQNIGVRQSSPVRIQTGSGAPIVAVSVQSSSNLQQGSSPQSTGIDKTDQVSRLLKK